MFYFDLADDKKVLKSDLLPDVMHFFTTRECCLFSKDRDVLDNKREIEAFLGKKMATNGPVHGCHIEKVTNKFFYENTDALLLEKGKAAFMNFGDCVPLLFYCNHVGMIVHAGWRGTVQEIAKKALAKMVCDYGFSVVDIKVVIGPAICHNCYEVGQEVFSALAITITERKGLYVENNRFFVDLKEINSEQLKESGVKYIDVCPYCTACGEGKNLFYSYRRTHTGDRHSAVLAVS